MKKPNLKSTLLLLSIFTSIVVSAQNYKPNPALDKFVGTWIYNQDGKTIEVILKKVIVVLNSETKIDEIEGHYKFINEDKLIENTQKRGRAAIRNGTNLLNDDSQNINQITLSISDSIKRKSGNISLVYKPGNPDALQWALRNMEGPKMRRAGEPPFDRTFTLPTYMVLTRKKD